MDFYSVAPNGRRLSVSLAPFDLIENDRVAYHPTVTFSSFLVV